MTEITHLLFFGSMMLPDECQQTPGCPFSANRFQYELLSSLHGVHANRVTAICPVPARSFPRDRPLVFRRRDRVVERSFCIISPPFINLGPLKVLSLIVSALITALLVRKTTGKPQVIMLYNPYLGYALPALLLARLWQIPAVAIVADMSPPVHWRVRGLARQLEARLQRWCIGRFDGLLPFSIYVALDLHFKGPVMRLDPGVDVFDFQGLTPMPSVQCERTLLFSGTLNFANGLEFLLDTFGKVSDPTIHLWISGRGDMQRQVEELARQDSRIYYWGFVDRVELLEIMRRSLILVNPRPSSLPEHRYNFPSKILEYLASGRPVISTASSDIAQEYGDFLLLQTEETPDQFARLIEETFARSMDDLDEVGRQGREYVLGQKNWAVLSERVTGFLTALIGSRGL